MQRIRTASEGETARSSRARRVGSLEKIAHAREEQRLKALQKYEAASNRFTMQYNRIDLNPSYAEKNVTQWPYASGRARWQVALPNEQVFKWSPSTVNNMMNANLDADPDDDQATKVGPFDTVLDLTDPTTQAYIKSLRDWSANMDSEDRASIEWWSRGGDALMQKLARAKSVWSDEKLREAFARQPSDDADAEDDDADDDDDQGDRLQRVIRSEAILHRTLLTAPATPFPTLLWRGLTLSWEATDALAATRDPFVTRSPQSWSRSPSVADGYEGSNVLLGLLIPRESV